MRKSMCSNYVKLITCFLLLVIIQIGPNAKAALAPVSERTTITASGAASAIGGRLPPPPKVKVNKCCHYGEYLDMTKSCVPGSSEHWVPLIYLINKRNHFKPKGESPKFITFEENVRPANDIAPQSTAEQEQPIEDDNSKANGCSNTDLELFTGSSNFVVFSNGSLYLSERSQFIELRNYCVDREAALVCFPQQKKSETPPLLKLKKCCGKHGIYNTTTNSCQFETKHNLLQLPISQAAFQTIYGFPKCYEAALSFAMAGDFSVANLDNKTGELKLHNKNFTLDDYCLEHISMSAVGENALDDASVNVSTVKVFACLHHFAKDMVGAVADDDTSSEQIQVAVLNFGIMISVIFLAATLFAGYLTPSVHHALHWRCQIYYIFCLFFGDLLLAYTQITHHMHLGTVTCKVIASCMHFFFLAAFFWLNTMCFNIWWTFRDFRPSSLERNQERFRLRLYSAYAWGIPLLIAAIAASMDQLVDTEVLKPGFGVRSCWFSGENLEIFAYFFGPVGLLLCANIVLFISTTHQLTCGLWKGEDVKSTTEKTALGKVCLKLVVVMGVTWIADIISWLVGGPHSAWFFTDLINALQGVFIFLVVGCQPKVWASLKRMCCPSARQEITNTTNGAQQSSSSHGQPSMTACGETTQNTSVNATLGTSQKPKIPMETIC